MIPLGWCVAVAFALLFVRQCSLTAQRDRALVEVIMAAVEQAEEYEAAVARGVFVIPPDFIGERQADTRA